MMIAENRLRNTPGWIRRAIASLKKLKFPARLVYIVFSVLATLWFLVRVIPKPSRATYPCMQAAAPVMSGFIIWLIYMSGASMAFKKARQKVAEAKYLAAVILIMTGIGAAALFTIRTARESKAGPIEAWYQPNVPVGNARGIHPGRVAWAHNPGTALWDGETGFWWEDAWNQQQKADQLLEEILVTLTGEENGSRAWDALFRYFNTTRHHKDTGYKAGEKIAVKINQNNTYSHESNNEINANPQLVLSLLSSLVREAGVPQECIAVTDPSRFITDNVYDKCHSQFPDVHYMDHVGGNGREKAAFVDRAIPYSVDNGKVAQGLATCIVEADYLINLALMKGHVGQGVTLVAKNYFGCTSIETDWRKNAHSSGFNQNKDGSHKYLVFTDFLGHKDLGEKTMLFMVDGIYGNKFVDREPAYKWALAPFENQWPCSLFASQDGVAIDAVVLDFILTEWPDAPDLMYSDYYLLESALAGNPPSGTIYDPEQDGTTLESLGVAEHWNNPVEKKYSRNLGGDTGIELVYKKIDQALSGS
jgi:hypothetical protein